MGKHIYVFPPCEMTRDFQIHHQEWFDVFMIGSNLLVVQVLLLEVPLGWDHSLLYCIDVSNDHAQSFPG